MADDTLDTELRAVLSILPDTQQYSKSKGSEQVPGADTIATTVDQQVKVHGIRRHNGSLFYQEHPGGDSAACMAGWGGGGMSGYGQEVMQLTPTARTVPGLFQQLASQSGC